MSYKKPTTRFSNFDDYLGVIVENLAKNIIYDIQSKNMMDALIEVVYDLYYAEITDSKAVKTIESFHNHILKNFNNE